MNDVYKELARKAAKKDKLFAEQAEVELVEATLWTEVIYQRPQAQLVLSFLYHPPWPFELAHLWPWTEKLTRKQ